MLSSTPDGFGILENDVLDIWEGDAKGMISFSLIITVNLLTCNAYRSDGLIWGGLDICKPCCTSCSLEFSCCVMIAV
jgi:hypothetical protein